MIRYLSLCASLAIIAAPAAGQQAGQLIAADPVVETPGGMQTWRVSYWTSDGSGRPRAVTGMVVAPREAMPRAPRRVIAWTHGTWGIASRCAPSLSPNFWKVTAALDAVKSGHVEVAPDYPGLGSAGMHPFLVGVDTARSVVDGVRAARQMAGAAAGEFQEQQARDLERRGIPYVTVTGPVEQRLERVKAALGCGPAVPT